MYVINPKEKYTLARDNQAKRVGKLACQRASADCSASVPSLTEHSTKCRRANGGRAKSMPCRRFATDSIHPAGDSIPSLRLGSKKDRSKTVFFFLSYPNNFEPLIPMRNLIFLSQSFLIESDIRTFSAFQDQSSAVLSMCINRLKVAGSGF